MQAGAPREVAAPVAEAVKQQPKAVEAKAAEPKVAEPKLAEPKAVEQKAVEQKAVEAKAVEAKAVDPKSDKTQFNVEAPRSKPTAAQQQPSRQPRISVTYDGTPITDVLACSRRASIARSCPPGRERQRHGPVHRPAVGRGAQGHRMSTASTSPKMPPASSTSTPSSHRRRRPRAARHAATAHWTTSSKRIGPARGPVVRWRG